MSFLDKIEAFLKANEMSATAFGMAALNDPRFVMDLRGGRDVKMSTIERVEKFMAQRAEKNAA